VKSTIDIEKAKSEDDAITSVMAAIETAGYGDISLYLLNSSGTALDERLSAPVGALRGATRSSVPLDSNDPIATTLHQGDARFMEHESNFGGYDSVAAGVPVLGAAYFIPLRLESEKIGTVQVNLTKRQRRSAGSTLRDQNSDAALELQALAGHLAVALSRIRSIGEVVELTNHVLSSSRFVVAETLAAMAVHSLGHRLNSVLRQIETDLKRKDYRENRIVFETLTKWQRVVADAKRDIDGALDSVRASVQSTDLGTELHPSIQQTLDIWSPYIRTAKCVVTTELKADNSVCRIPGYAFREILTVLLVNAVQAHSRSILLRSYNERNVRVPRGHRIEMAFCVECADDGDGLATKDTEAIFESRYTTKPTKFGTGLGLFIARRLARNGGGEIYVNEQHAVRSKGTSFIVVLPLFES
jgi:signal transduction histidine kinase